MRELTSIEISKRVAEINGYNPVIFGGMVKTNDNFNYEPMGKSTRNKALLLDLIIKYGVNIEFVGAGVECLASFPVKNIKNKVFESTVGKAVCLTIIKANENPELLEVNNG